MHDSVVQPQTGSLNARLCSARKQLAQYLSELVAFWNRQPLDRYWPPHP